MAEADLSDSTAHETSGKPAEATGRWITKTVFLSAAFVLAAAVLVVAGKMVSDWIEHRENAELAQHPWWERPLTVEQVEDIVARIAALEADENAERTDRTRSLEIVRSGMMQEVTCRYSTEVFGHSRTYGEVRADAWSGVYILFFPGERGRGNPLSRHEARVKLRKMLDKAERSPPPIIGGTPY